MLYQEKALEFCINHIIHVTNSIKCKENMQGVLHISTLLRLLASPFKVNHHCPRNCNFDLYERKLIMNFFTISWGGGLE